MRRVLFAVTAGLFLSSCSFLGLGGEPDIAGNYAITTTFQGQSMAVSMALVRQDDTYSGTVDSDMSSFTIRSVTRQEDGGWLIRASGMDGTLVVRMTLEEEGRISGTWSVGDMGGSFTGERVGG